jgi:glyoxylase-like metal-dependent hydrolase (beta-lactamase superfamily II)
MKTRRILELSIAVAILAIAASTAHAQGRFDEVEIEATALGDGVHMLTGAGGNLGLSAGPDGVFLIDDQFAPLTERILAAVARIDGGPVRFIVNTHWHGDHTGGNEKMGAAGALLIAHDNVRVRMSSEQFTALWDRHTPPSPAGALPVVTFDNNLTFHINDDEIRVFHVPHAHTDGDSMIYFREADVLHAGDVFFNGDYPYIDVDAGGSIDGMISAVEIALGLTGPKSRIIPGHGPLAGREELVSYLEMLETLRSRIEPYVRAGRSVEETRAEKPTADLDEKWGGGFIDPDNIVRIVHDSLSSRE